MWGKVFCDIHTTYITHMRLLENVAPFRCDTPSPTNHQTEAWTAFGATSETGRPALAPVAEASKPGTAGSCCWRAGEAGPAGASPGRPGSATGSRVYVREKDPSHIIHTILPTYSMYNTPHHDPLHLSLLFLTPPLRLIHGLTPPHRMQ